MIKKKKRSRGRPKLEGSQRVIFLLLEEHVEMLDEIADEIGDSRGAAIRKILDRELKKRERKG